MLSIRITKSVCVHLAINHLITLKSISSRMNVTTSEQKNGFSICIWNWLCITHDEQSIRLKLYQRFFEGYLYIIVKMYAKNTDVARQQSYRYPLSRTNTPLKLNVLHCTNAFEFQKFAFVRCKDIHLVVFHCFFFAKQQEKVMIQSTVRTQRKRKEKMEFKQFTKDSIESRCDVNVSIPKERYKNTYITTHLNNTCTYNANFTLSLPSIVLLVLFSYFSYCVVQQMGVKSLWE